MRYHGTLIRPLADQGDRDGRFIDPAGVVFVEGRDYPLTIEFDMDRVVGYGTLERAADGSILVTGAITEGDIAAAMADPPRLAAGIACRSEDILPGRVGRVVSSCRLNALALTGNHSDPGQPPIEVTP